MVILNKKGNWGHLVGFLLALSIMAIIYGLYILTQDFWIGLLGAAI